jgi:hypothetical protein
MHASVHDHNLYRQSSVATNVDICSCTPAFSDSCPGGVMVYSGLEGLLTPLYSRMQDGWCCATPE